MDDECEHRKARITLDSGESICLICDDVDVTTLDSRAKAQIDQKRYD